jgi:hypothetical protein
VTFFFFFFLHLLANVALPILATQVGRISLEFFTFGPPSTSLPLPKYLDSVNTVSVSWEHLNIVLFLYGVSRCEGQTALYRVSSRDYAEVMRSLIERGADLNAECEDWDGKFLIKLTPLRSPAAACADWSITSLSPPMRMRRHSGLFRMYVEVTHPPLGSPAILLPEPHRPIDLAISLSSSCCYPIESGSLFLLLRLARGEK